jgi:4'-phosphopantetheinyl transferase
MGADVLVHVWVQSIEAARPRRHELERVLTEDERARMARFRREADALRFLVGRATLRMTMADALGIEPTAVVLEVGEYGKLVTVGGPHANVSHSGDVVIVALCADAEIGVDVEEIVAAHADATDLDAFFSPAEVRELLTYPREQRVEAFFHIWTTKEALIKAAATGLSLSLQSFDVSIDPRQPPALLAARCAELSSHICLAAIDVPSGYAAVLAVFAPACRIEYREMVGWSR